MNSLSLALVVIGMTPEMTPISVTHVFIISFTKKLFLQGTVQGQTKCAKWQNLHMIISTIKMKNLLAVLLLMLYWTTVILATYVHDAHLELQFTSINTLEMELCG